MSRSHVHQLTVMLLFSREQQTALPLKVCVALGLIPNLITEAAWY